MGCLIVNAILRNNKRATKIGLLEMPASKYMVG